MAQDPIPDEIDGEEEELLDLRYVGEHQIACSGADLTDMLNCDEGIGPELYARLGLTATQDTSLEFTFFTFAEVSEEAYYMVTFPEGTDFANFSIAQALAIEEISPERFEELPTGDEPEPCDGDCDHCPQDCIGKQPVIYL